MSGEEQNEKKTIEFVIIVVLIVNLLFEMQYMSQTMICLLHCRD